MDAIDNQNIKIKEMAHEKKVFICYETKTGLSYAIHLKESLEKMRMPSFVAHEDLKAGEPEQNVRENAIKECRYFVVVVTPLALESEEVKKEISLAGKYDKKIITCKYKKVDRALLSKLPIISKLQQIEFETKEELANKLISEILEIEKNPITIEQESDSATEKKIKLILTNKDTDFYKVNSQGNNRVATIKLFPNATTNGIDIPTTKGYGIKLAFKDANGNDVIPDDAVIELWKETISKREPLGEYEYRELKGDVKPLKDQIHISYAEELVLYVEEKYAGKIQNQNIEFRFAINLCVYD